MAVLWGDEAYAHLVEPSDTLSACQRRFVEVQLARIQAWWESWPGAAA